MTLFIRWTVLTLLVCSLLAPAMSNVALAQDDAQAQLDKTAAAMLALQSFHFELDTTAGSTTFQDLFELDGVSGDVVRPTNFKATVAVKLAIISLTFEVIGVDGDLWVKNPLGGDDTFVQLTGADSDFQIPPTILLNPDKLVTDVLSYLDNPTLAERETLDGKEMTIVTGTFDPSKITLGDTAAAEMGDFEPASEPLQIKGWIDDQDRLVRVDFIGPLFAFEEGAGRLVRTITFSNFDEAITIQKPA